MKSQFKKIALGLMLGAGCASACQAAGYELTVYSDDVAQAGEFEGETIVSLARPRPNLIPGVRRVVQGLAELNYGLGNGWVIGLEVPGVYTGESRKFAGAAIEIQYVAPHDATRGWYWGFRADAGRFSSVYVGEAEAAIEINPILGYRFGSFHLAMNPTIELPKDRSNGTRMSFNPAAKLSYQVSGDDGFSVEYFGHWGPARSWLPPAKRDETLYAVWDRRLALGHLSAGLGHGIRPAAGSVDRWIAKIGLQFELD